MDDTRLMCIQDCVHAEVGVEFNAPLDTIVHFRNVLHSQFLE